MKSAGAGETGCHPATPQTDELPGRIRTAHHRRCTEGLPHRRRRRDAGDSRRPRTWSWEQGEDRAVKTYLLVLDQLQ